VALDSLRDDKDYIGEGASALLGRAAARHGHPVEFAGVLPNSSYGGWFSARIVPTGS
jgi:hypothetical protein